MKCSSVFVIICERRQDCARHWATELRLPGQKDFLVAVRHFHLASCHQLRSDNKHAVCVFTREKTWVKTNQLSCLLSGMVSRSLSVHANV